MKPKVMFIDDQPAMVQLVKLIVEQAGYEAIGAGGGAEGLELMARDRPDVLLLNLQMPDMNGWQVYQHMKTDEQFEQLRDIPVIIVTARDQLIDRVLALYIARVQDYITKPFTPDQLVKSIRDVLAGDNRPALPA